MTSEGLTDGASPRPKLAVWKFASCDGCQLTLLDCEDELLTLAGTVQIAHFTEMTRASVAGPYDLSLVEGSITTAADAERIQQVRAVSKTLVTIGACATAGGIQGLRNFAADGEYAATVYAHPEYISSLSRSTPIADHVPVDYELHGCPIDRRQLMEVLTRVLSGRKPVIPGYSVCQQCKHNGTVCLLVADGVPCLGPVTRAGCGAICPSNRRGCFGCFGPTDSANSPIFGRNTARTGTAAGRRIAPIPDLQRRGAGFPRRVSDPIRRCLVTGTSARREQPPSEPRLAAHHRVGNLSRVEGEGSLRIDVQDGAVRGVTLDIFEPPRYFEALLRGRGFTEAPDITARICGICPVAYQMSACAAMESACGAHVDHANPVPTSPPLLRRMDSEPRPARVPAPCTGLPRLCRRRRAGRTRPVVGRARAPDQTGG